MEMNAALESSRNEQESLKQNIAVEIDRLDVMTKEKETISEERDVIIEEKEKITKEKDEIQQELDGTKVTKVTKLKLLINFSNNYCKVITNDSMLALEMMFMLTYCK